MIKLSIPLPELKAALLFASSDRSRYILNAVCLVLRDAGHPVNLVATDGRRICVIKSSAVIQEGVIPQGKTDVLIPPSLIKLATPYNKKEKLVMLSIELIEPTGIPAINSVPRYKLTFDDGDQSVSKRSVEGRYPNYAATFPRERFAYNAGALCINSDFVADLGKVTNLLKRGKGYATAILMACSKPGGPIHVRLSGVHNFTCIIMPVRVGNGDPVPSTEFDTPLWIEAPQPVTAGPVTNAP